MTQKTSKRPQKKTKKTKESRRTLKILKPCRRVIHSSPKEKFPNPNRNNHNQRYKKELGNRFVYRKTLKVSSMHRSSRFGSLLWLNLLWNEFSLGLRWFLKCSQTKLAAISHFASQLLRACLFFCVGSWLAYSLFCATQGSQSDFYWDVSSKRSSEEQATSLSNQRTNRQAISRRPEALGDDVSKMLRRWFVFIRASPSGRVSLRSARAVHDRASFDSDGNDNARNSATAAP